MASTRQLHFQLLLLVILCSTALFSGAAAGGCPVTSRLPRRSLLQTTQPPLQFGFYDDTCPSLDQIITDRLNFHTLEDIRTPARILRLFFHDCVAAGCEASILLNSTSSNQAEKDAAISATLDKFYVIEDIKAAVEKACPRIVSCADILALAAVQSVRMVTILGPTYSCI